MISSPTSVHDDAVDESAESPLISKLREEFQAQLEADRALANGVLRQLVDKHAKEIDELEKAQEAIITAMEARRDKALIEAETAFKAHTDALREEYLEKSTRIRQGAALSRLNMLLYQSQCRKLAKAWYKWAYDSKATAIAFVARLSGSLHFWNAIRRRKVLGDVFREWRAVTLASAQHCFTDLLFTGFGRHGESVLRSSIQSADPIPSMQSLANQHDVVNPRSQTFPSHASTHHHSNVIVQYNDTDGTITTMRQEADTNSNDVYTRPSPSVTVPLPQGHTTGQGNRDRTVVGIVLAGLTATRYQRLSPTTFAALVQESERVNTSSAGRIKSTVARNTRSSSASPTRQRKTPSKQPISSSGGDVVRDVDAIVSADWAQGFKQLLLPGKFIASSTAVTSLDTNSRRLSVGASSRRSSTQQPTQSPESGITESFVLSPQYSEHYVGDDDVVASVESSKPIAFPVPVSSLGPQWQQYSTNPTDEYVWVVPTPDGRLQIVPPPPSPTAHPVPLQQQQQQRSHHRQQQQQQQFDDEESRQLNDSGRYYTAEQERQYHHQQRTSGNGTRWMCDDRGHRVTRPAHREQQIKHLQQQRQQFLQSHGGVVAMQPYVVDTHSTVIQPPVMLDSRPFPSTQLLLPSTTRGGVPVEWRRGNVVGVVFTDAARLRGTAMLWDIARRLYTRVMMRTFALWHRTVHTDSTDSRFAAVLAPKPTRGDVAVNGAIEELTLALGIAADEIASLKAALDDAKAQATQSKREVWKLKRQFLSEITHDDITSNHVSVDHGGDESVLIEPFSHARHHHRNGHMHPEAIPMQQPPPQHQQQQQHNSGSLRTSPSSSSASKRVTFADDDDDDDEEKQHQPEPLSAHGTSQPFLSTLTPVVPPPSTQDTLHNNSRTTSSVTRLMTPSLDVIMRSPKSSEGGPPLPALRTNLSPVQLSSAFDQDGSKVGDGKVVEESDDNSTVESELSSRPKGLMWWQTDTGSGSDGDDVPVYRGQPATQTA